VTGSDDDLVPDDRSLADRVAAWTPPWARTDDAATPAPADGSADGADRPGGTTAGAAPVDGEAVTPSDGEAVTPVDGEAVTPSDGARPAADEPDQRADAGTAEEPGTAAPWPEPAAAPEAAEPEGIEPEAAEPEGIAPEAAESDGAEPEGIEPEGIEPEAAEPDGIESEGAESEGVESEGVESPRAGTGGTEPDAAGPEPADANGAAAGDAVSRMAAGDGADGTDAEDDANGAGAGDGTDAGGTGEAGDGAASALPELDDPETLRAALEAILIVVDEPVSEVVLAQVLERPTATVAAAVRDLAERYTVERRGFELRQAAGGWRMYTRDDFAPYVERFVLDGQQVRLTQAALETLAVIAYKQPVSRSRVSAIRGVNCDGVIRTLLTRGLIEECGAEPETGAHLYRTTTLFLERMGINSTDELPELAPFLPDELPEEAS